MRIHRLCSVTVTLGLASLFPLSVAPASAHGVARLGTVEFKVECSAAAQQKFNTAMALYHSFAWPQAVAAFKDIAATDPACGMAQWGLAMSLLGNPFVWPAGLTPQVMNDVAAALDAAKAAGLRTSRERDYVDAVVVFVRDPASTPHAQRMQAYDAALGAVAARNPGDKEAAILSALITSANFNPADKTYANQLKAARTLEPLFKEYPNHPGVAHYLIHSYDYPPIANQGLPAAKAYAAIAPDAAHALHMPAHIFTRVGYWKESIAANRESARVAGDATFDGHHAMDYMVYAHLQLVQDEAARQAMQRSFAMKPIDNFAAAFAYAAMPARIALERGDWAAAAALPLTPAADAYPWKKYPQAEAINAYARGIGAARSGNATLAREQQARLVALRDAAKELRLNYWVEQIDIQTAALGALALCAEGKSAECIDGLREAARREDATEKHVVTPGPLVPARELLADMLLAANRYAEALREYEKVTTIEPNRYRTLAGAMAAAQRAGEPAKAQALAHALVKLGSEADSPRASLQQAKQIAGGVKTTELAPGR
jgi:hypothetical protein